MQQFPRCFSLFAYTFISVGLLTGSTDDFIHFSGSLLALPTDSDVGHHEIRWVSVGQRGSILGGSVR